jgi:hypothetical protein
MRKLIVATVALAFLASPVLAQDKSGTSTAPAAKSDTMSKGEMSKSKKKSKSRKSMKKSTDDTMKKQ